MEHFKGTFTTEQYVVEQQRVRDPLAAEMGKPGGAYLRAYVDAWDALE